jgi:hypothetical protein
MKLVLDAEEVSAIVVAALAEKLGVKPTEVKIVPMGDDDAFALRDIAKHFVVELG